VSRTAHDKHLDRWKAARDAFKAATGRDIEAYALVAVDSTGEVYYGANFSHNESHRRAILPKLAALFGDLKSLTKKTDELATRS
jgi:hypothetical protein